MEKQAFVPGLAAKAIGFTAGKILPKALNAGYKGLVRPMARMAFKRPGLALTGAMMPSWIGGYSNTAGQKGLSSLPRKLPKFASARTQGEEMSDNKYPAVFYKVAGFEKMAAEAETAHRLVKKAAGILSLFGFGNKTMSAKQVVLDELKKNLGKALSGGNNDDLAKLITGLRSKPLAAPEIGRILRKLDDIAGAKPDFGKLISKYNDDVREIGKQFKPKNMREYVAALGNTPPVVGAAVVGAPAYYYGNKAYKNRQENKEMDASYRNMLRVFPELQRESPQTTRQNFDFIKQYSPTVAKNPYAAGTLVKGVVAGRGIDQSTIKTLLEVEKVKADAKPRNSGILATVGALI